jgi:hypothetical protein
MDSSTALAYSFVQTFNDVILFPTIALLSPIAVLFFMYGCFLYIVRAGDPVARAEGTKHITWGIVGVVVMLSAYTIMSIAAGTFGLNDELDRANEGKMVVPIGTGGSTGGTPTGGSTGGAPTGGSTGGAPTCGQNDPRYPNC